jgi:hypothetical protein
MNNESRATRKLIQLFSLCCFIICSCSTASSTNTRTTFNFLPTTSLATPKTQATWLGSPTTSQSATKEPEIRSQAEPFDLVAQRFAEFVKWRRDCSYTPRLCDIDKFTITGTQFSDDFAAMMHEFAANNIFARPGDGERKIIVKTISRDESTMTAIVHGCVYDTVVLYMGAGIYDDKIASSISSWTMQWHNDDWFWTNYQIHKKVFSQNLCNT